mmetsp:Transcript_107527/g.213545  ORF Transcript_107527/g.213545 Transcript_107527/m.213545 type:complete len:85 (+) Transcript_107527:793-1047(+)
MKEASAVLSDEGTTGVKLSMIKLQLHRIKLRSTPAEIMSLNRPKSTTKAKRIHTTPIMMLLQNNTPPRLRRVKIKGIKPSMAIA